MTARCWWSTSTADGCCVSTTARRPWSRPGRWPERDGSRDRRRRCSWRTTVGSSGRRSTGSASRSTIRRTPTSRPASRAAGSNGSTSPPARRRCSNASATVVCCVARTTWSSTRSVACGSPTTARVGGRASTAVGCTTSRRRESGDGAVREVAFPLLGPNGVGLSPDGRRVYVAETHTGRLWAWDLDSPGVVRPGGRFVGGPPRWGVRRGDAVLVRLAGGRGGRPDRDRRDRRRHRGGHARRPRDRRPSDPRRRDDQPGLRRIRRASCGDHAVALGSPGGGRVAAARPRRPTWPRPGSDPEGARLSTAAEILRSHTTRDTPALFFEDRSWTYRELIAEACRRAALFGELRDPDRPPHVGVLLDNVPEYLFWLAGAALSGAVVVGINSTYRGDQLGQLIRHTDCQLIVTDPASARACSTASTPACPTIACSTSTTDAIPRARVAPQPTRIPTARGDGGGPVAADLHVGLDRDARRRCAARRVASPAPARTSPRSPSSTDGDVDLRAAAVLPLELAVHRLGVGAPRRRSRSPRGRSSRRRARCPTSAAAARRCSRTPARS